MSIYRIKNFYTILQIVKARILINFDRSLTNLHRTGEKLPKNVELMEEKHEWRAWLLKLKIRTHPSTILLEFLLSPELQLPLFNSPPNTKQKWN